MRYDIAHHSARGARPNNQDRIALAERDNAVLMVVADGLGGHRGGEIAAEILAQTMLHAFHAVRAPIIDRPSAFLALGILQAHQAILRRSKASMNTIQPRTTCVMCLIQNGYAYWAHVGDSRLYHFRHGRLLQRTQDHSTVEELRKDGLLTEDEMRQHPQKGRLTICVGGPNRPKIALGEETALARDDVLLLCSDGVWEAYTPEELLRTIERDDLDEAVEEMLFGAERKMQEHCDNLSAICVRWLEHAPSTLPLQGNSPVQVDERAMIDGAATITAAAQQREKPAAPKDPQRSVADEIRELEQYLRKRDPKV
ncbi:MAG TPA: protein phosphatase 2C domain-containing protein [Burkholderiaceae bacterium]|nr:protein phosphatase 2C domain-containing protein [Burkholderiaceae bacterium]